MYNSSYSQARFGLEPTKLNKSKEKSCGYYMRIVFFFSSLIQSLIIISLVLFLVYGQSQQSPEEKRVQDLAQACSELHKENLLLQQHKGQLKTELNRTLSAKVLAEAELLKLRLMANMSYHNFQHIGKRLSICEQEKMSLSRRLPTGSCPGPNLLPSADMKSLQERNRHLEGLLTLVNSNFTQMVGQLRAELGDVTKERNEHRLSNINLNQQKASLEKELEIYSEKCKGDFVSSLQGINTVTKAFLNKIESFFTTGTIFHISCLAQKQYLEQIHSNCTSLSHEVETKFQHYLNQVGTTISDIQSKSSKLMVQNSRLEEDLKWCRLNSSAAATESRRSTQDLREKHDKETERLLKNQRSLYETKELLEQQLKVKNGEIALLSNQVHLLNTTLAQCIPRQLPVKPQPYVPSTFLKPGNVPFAVPGPGTATAGVNTMGPATGTGGSAQGLGAPWVNMLVGATARTGANGVPVPDQQAALHRHLKELQKYASTGSEVSG
ncbi:plasmalemma vesicle-associated protein-like isoform X1 [Scleropages formosus]|uniref:plasmalemma vesicle-associated protein-like isoform X1 n=1 Tax=Scleropages formosus TaxID=113540 RepID=UPI0010FA7C3A|nr:plasmalemma vesicle-associated protein-like isoform X1 [Scleropages formosus]